MHPKIMERFLGNRLNKNPGAKKYFATLADGGPEAFKKGMANEIAHKKENPNLAEAITHLTIALLAYKKGLTSLDYYTKDKNEILEPEKTIRDILSLSDFYAGLCDIEKDEEIYDALLNCIIETFQFKQDFIQRLSENITRT